MQLTEHAVVVVGAAGGIGRAVCEERLALGGVAALDRPGPAMDTLAQSINEPRLRSYTGDASALQSMRSISQRIQRELGRVHGLVNVAGKFEVVPFVDSPPEHWGELICERNAGGYGRAVSEHADDPGLRGACRRARQPR